MNFDDDNPYQEFYHEDGSFDYDGAEQHFKEQTNKDEKKKREVDNQWQAIQTVKDNITLAGLDGEQIARIVKNSKSRIVIQTTSGKVFIIEAVNDEKGSASLEVSA